MSEPIVRTAHPILRVALTTRETHVPVVLNAQEGIELPGGEESMALAANLPKSIFGALQLFLSGKRNMFVTGEEKTNDDSVGSGTQHLVVFSLQARPAQGRPTYSPAS